MPNKKMRKTNPKDLYFALISQKPQKNIILINYNLLLIFRNLEQLIFHQKIRRKKEIKVETKRILFLNFFFLRKSKVFSENFF